MSNPLIRACDYYLVLEPAQQEKILTAQETLTWLEEWLEKIETRVYGDDPLLKESKPHPEPYLLAAKKLNINPENSWAVEDSDLGSKAALKAGCKVFVLKNRQEENITNKINM